MELYFQIQLHWGTAIRITDTEVDSLIRKQISTDSESSKRGPGNGIVRIPGRQFITLRQDMAN